MIMPERNSCAWDYPNTAPIVFGGGCCNKLINNYLQIQRAIKDPLIALDVAY